jgi:hypothetical protein
MISPRMAAKLIKSGDSVTVRNNVNGETYLVILTGKPVGRAGRWYVNVDVADGQDGEPCFPYTAELDRSSWTIETTLALHSQQ